MKHVNFNKLALLLVFGLFLMSSCEKEKIERDEDVIQEDDPSPTVAKDALFNIQIDGEDWKVQSFDIALTSEHQTSSAEETFGISIISITAYNKTIENRKANAALDSIVFNFAIPYTGNQNTLPGYGKGDFPLKEKYEDIFATAEYKGDQTYRPNYNLNKTPGLVKITEARSLHIPPRTEFYVEGTFSMEVYPMKGSATTGKKMITGSFKLPNGNWNLPQ